MATLITGNKNIVVAGSSGHAKVVLDVIEREDKYRVVGMIDPFREVGESLYGYPVLGADENLAALVKDYELHGCVVAIGDNWRRYLVAKKIMALVPTVEFVSTIHPSAQLARGVAIGRGTVLMAGSIVNSDSRIGEFCILNTNASVDHDCEMGNFSSLAPKATTGGMVRIGAFSAVSIGANIVHQRCIGKHTVIGAGAVVLDDIPDFCVAYGSPARVVRERKEGDTYL